MAQTIQVQIVSGARQSYRGGHSWIARNYTNLIRIQRAKSLKNKQVLPNILSLIARSAL